MLADVRVSVEVRKLDPGESVIYMVGIRDNSWVVTSNAEEADFYRERGMIVHEYLMISDDDPDFSKPWWRPINWVWAAAVIAAIWAAFR